MTDFSIRYLLRLIKNCTFSSPRQMLTITALLFMAFLIPACSLEKEQQESQAALIDNEVRFIDVTEESGINFQHGAFRWDVYGDAVAMMGGGLCWLDFNNDDWLDLYAVNSYAVDEAGRWEVEGGLPRNALFRNDGGTFTDVSQGSGSDLQVRGNGCVAADLNLDGWTDLYVTTARVNHLLWNNGDGTFSQGEEEAGVDLYGWQTGAAVGDLNGDGLPDLFVAGYVDINNRNPESDLGFPNTHLGRRDQLFINQGNDPNSWATFKEVGVAAGLEDSEFEYGLGAVLSDFDQDGDLDLLVANDTNPNRLYENIPLPGAAGDDPLGLGFRLVEVGQYANIADNNSGMGVASGDMDNDGRFDLVITNLGDQLHSVYANQSTQDELNFIESTSQIGLPQMGVGWTGWGIAWADVDLDSDQDLIVANGTVPVLDPPNDVQKIQFFANMTAQGMQGMFQDLTDLSGFNEIEPLLARGSAVADYDNDGDPDIAISALGNKLLLLRNEQNSGGNWLSVQTLGLNPGALITAHLPNNQQLICETHAGSSYLSSEDPRCHFGLGSAGMISRLEIQLPDGAYAQFDDIEINTVFQISKDDLEYPQLNDSLPQPSIGEVLFQTRLKAGGAVPLEMLPAPSQELVELGEALFWDKLLSGNKDISCATCHHPLAGSGDNLSVSVGTGGLGYAADRQMGQGRILIPRNATEIYNRGAAGWHTMFWDGRVAEYPPGPGAVAEFQSPAGADLPLGLDNVLAVQAMFPVTSRDEMRGDESDRDQFGWPNEIAEIADDDFEAIWQALMDRLMVYPLYQELFAKAYPEIPPSWLRFQHAANAIAAYEMVTFTKADSPWDRFLSGDHSALTADAQRGANLFYGEAGCSRCHNGSLLTDQKYYNIGVPQLGPGKGDEAPADHGRGRETGASYDTYAFRTPPLRNVAISGPWMHNGAYTTLEGTVKHHLDPVRALENYDPSQLSPIVEETYAYQTTILGTLDSEMKNPIELTDQQIDDLLAFLESLTSPSLANGCDLMVESVPSGLPIDIDPANPCG